MTSMTKLLALAVIAGVMSGGGAAFAKDDGHGHDKDKAGHADKAHKGRHGQVVSNDNGSLKLKTKDGGEITVETNSSTVVKIEGKEASVSDIKAGMYVKVEPESGVATRIIVKGKRDKEHKDKDKDEHEHKDGEKHDH